MRIAILAALGSAVASPASPPPASPPPPVAQPVAPAPTGPAVTDPAVVNPAAGIPARRPRFPGFAQVLTAQAVMQDGTAWTPRADAALWAELARSPPASRQNVRWAFARSLIGKGRPAEAIGVLDVMAADDPDLRLVPAFQLARGVALAAEGRAADALATLSLPKLQTNAEACAWRMRALAERGDAGAALAQVNCALPAINRRPRAERKPFALAAIDAAIGAGQPKQALHWLERQSQNAAAANILRGRAYLALGEVAAARARFQRAGTPADRGERTAAALGLIEADIAQHRVAPAAAITRLAAVRFAWRGDAVERRALLAEFAQAKVAKDPVAMLRAGATLLRYHALGAAAAPLLEDLRATLAALLAPESTMPLPQIAGLYWDYREVAPSGPAGDLLALRLADRLAGASLYARAAELLHYQMIARATDVAQGPLSVRVATLRILAGDPKSAITALRESDGPAYPETMIQDRKRIEGVALALLGKTDAAFAALADVPGGDAIRAEILWRRHDWVALVVATGAALPPRRALDEVAQATILRHAIALAMIGDEARLRAVRARYEAAFAVLPSASAFDVLTSPVGMITPEKVAAAMAQIPSASPAGVYADLLATTQG